MSSIAPPPVVVEGRIFTRNRPVREGKNREIQGRLSGITQSPGSSGAVGSHSIWALPKSVPVA